MLHVMGGVGYSYKTLEQKIKFHRKRAQFHESRAAEWELILSQVQQLQRLEQLPADEQQSKIAPPKKTTKTGRRNDFARELLQKHVKDGIKPAEVRRQANEQGFICPDNYPYKLFRTMKAQGRLRQDEEGRYFLTEKK